MLIEIQQNDCRPIIPARDAIRGQLYEVVNAGAYSCHIGAVVFKTHSDDFYDFEGRIRFTGRNADFTLRRLPDGSKVIITQTPLPESIR